MLPYLHILPAALLLGRLPLASAWGYRFLYNRDGAILQRPITGAWDIVTEDPKSCTSLGFKTGDVLQTLDIRQYPRDPDDPSGKLDNKEGTFVKLVGFWSTTGCEGVPTVIVRFYPTPGTVQKWSPESMGINEGAPNIRNSKYWSWAEIPDSQDWGQIPEGSAARRITKHSLSPQYEVHPNVVSVEEREGSTEVDKGTGTGVEQGTELTRFTYKMDSIRPQIVVPRRGRNLLKWQNLQEELEKMSDDPDASPASGDEGEEGGETEIMRDKPPEKKIKSNADFWTEDPDIQQALYESFMAGQNQGQSQTNPQLYNANMFGQNMIPNPQSYNPSIPGQNKNPASKNPNAYGIDFNQEFVRQQLMAALDKIPLDEVVNVYNNPQLSSLPPAQLLNYLNYKYNPKMPEYANLISQMTEEQIIDAIQKTAAQNEEIVDAIKKNPTFWDRAFNFATQVQKVPEAQSMNAVLGAFSAEMNPGPQPGDVQAFQQMLQQAGRTQQATSGTAGAMSRLTALINSLPDPPLVETMPPYRGRRASRGRRTRGPSRTRRTGPGSRGGLPKDQWRGATSLRDLGTLPQQANPEDAIPQETNSNQGDEQNGSPEVDA